MSHDIKSIEVVPCDPKWPDQYEKEAFLIKNALGDNLIEIHHIGSTSIPGLPAKPKIDIIAAVEGICKLIVALEKVDYAYRGEWNIPFKFGFTKRGDVDVNLHIFKVGHPEIELNIMFRDYLRKHPEAVEAYAKLKFDLLKDDASFEKRDSMFRGYNLGKDAFIRDILKKAGFSRTRFLKCTHINEWEKAKEFRKRYFFDALGISDPYTWTFNHKEHAHFVFYKGVDVIGYAHIQLRPEKRAALRIIVLDESQRNQGHGSVFLSLIEKWLRSNDCQSLHVESSPEALKFYKRHHYDEMPFNDPDGYVSDPRDVSLGKKLQSNN